MGVASTRNPEIVSVFERQVRVMEESLTSEIRTRRGGLISWKREIRIEIRHIKKKSMSPINKYQNYAFGCQKIDSLSRVVTSACIGLLVREFFKA